MKITLVEPPRETWFVMGEYLPPPLGILSLAAYLDEKMPGVEIQVIDCQAEGLDWARLEKRVESFGPDIVAPSALATCNVYSCARTVELAKRVVPKACTVVGGQHFTALSTECLEAYPEIDVVVRGEGEQTIHEVAEAINSGSPIAGIPGTSTRHDGKIVDGPDRAPIPNLDDLPFPGYKFVEDIVPKYHFKMMAGSGAGYALIEGSRGCPHRCTFCSQWKHWSGTYRSKSPARIAEEMRRCYEEYGIRFIWLTDDNFGLSPRTAQLCEEIDRRGLSEEIMWFMQVRCDDIVKHQELIPKLRGAGNHWMLVGLESGNPETLNSLNKQIRPEDARKAMDILKDNDIFAQSTMIIGERKDDRDAMKGLREFVAHVDPDLTIFMILTPFPGTDLYEEARREGWIEDDNWANYDMVHAIMPTEYLSRNEVQEELYLCYRSFYGSMSRRLRGLLSTNAFKRRTYRYLASQGLLVQLRNLFR